jgi:hypothetical protein
MAESCRDVSRSPTSGVVCAGVVRCSVCCVAARVLRLMGVVDTDAFLHHFATTIGRRIYLPFDRGTPADGWSLWGQIMVLAHECQHVAQYDALGPLRFTWQYLGSTAGRTKLEAEAYRCQLELQHWRTGQIPSPHDLAASLRSYAVTDPDVKVAETMLAMSAESVKAGGLGIASVHGGFRSAVDVSLDLRTPMWTEPAPLWARCASGPRCWSSVETRM